ncbi:MAG: 4-hydroxy-tetrahydrodipicolinate synthase [Clostridia bacterium]|nr:4-hydroxy-tetrahydrodipicolinate synthase [Clostridia bacterium]
MSIFQGSAVALVTPFANDAVDVPALRRLVEYQLEGGTEAIVACGTTGEPATMTPDERELVVREVVKAVNGRVPVIAGTGSNCTKTVIETAKRYEGLGCAAQLVVTPYYNKTTQEGLYRHFMAIAEDTRLPMILYNVPSRTGVDIAPETLDRLAACESIVALKESSYDLPSVMEKMRRAGGRITFYSGNDDMVIPLMSLGAEGVVSVVSNVAPSLMSMMTHSQLSGDSETALGMQLSLLPLVRALFCEVNPIPVKAAMEMLSLCSGELRLPLIPISDANRQRLRDALIALGLMA